MKSLTKILDGAQSLLFISCEIRDVFEEYQTEGQCVFS